MNDQTKRIRTLNDTLRRTFAGGRVMMTAGVNALPEEMKSKILAAVQRFDDFNGDNDPYGEHDFGRIEVDGATIFFKIDAYDSTMTYGSEDPSDPDKTTRVLTIMLSVEY